MRPKIKDLDFHLFARPVHPEFFNGCAQRDFERENYRLKVNITTTGHLITFAHRQFVMSEICVAAHQQLPEGQLLLSYPLETDQSDQVVYRDMIRYQCRTQLEGANPKTFVTIQQQLDEQAACEGLVHRFEASGRNVFGAISYINVQSFHAHVRIRTFHTFPDTYSVLKSESKFVVLDPSPLEG
ncbi:MAG: DUF2617 family protein [Planctomycetota bacterium]